MLKIPTFSTSLINWYGQHKRNLPWRNTKDPYKIWISEIVLQQTRVDQGLAYYERFIKAFPSVSKLAAANEEEVLRMWQGLGYYSRARNLHFTAKVISNEHGGIFPTTYSEILSLKGIGEYTAAAISSFAYKLPYAVMDGNVMRVVTRLFGIEVSIHSGPGKKIIKESLDSLFDEKRPDEFNQAIMEFGALHCVPVNPNCEDCPFSTECVAFNTGKVQDLPIRKKSGQKKNRYFNYAVIRSGRKIILKKRQSKDIWQNMYEFPMKENQSMKESFDISDLLSVAQEDSIYILKEKSHWKTHLLSHQKIHARFHEFEVDQIETSLKDDWEILDLDDVDNYPLPKLIESYMNGR